MQLIQDVYLAAGAAYGENANVYVVDAGKELVLIDSGFDESQRKTVESTLELWSLSGLPVSHVFFTHAHFDHSGNARYFEEKGAVLHAGSNDADAMMCGDDRTIGYAFMGREFEACNHVEKIEGQQEFAVGNIRLEAIPVPGHTEGSMIFRMQKNGKFIVFAGDFLVVKGTCEDAQLGWNGGPDYDGEEYFQSIKRVKDLENDILLPGHGLPCMRKGRSLFNMLYKEALVNLR